MPDPLATLLDLDAGRLPPLTLRLDGHDIPLRLPESLPLAEALRLAELLERLADLDSDCGREPDGDETIRDIVRLAAPELEPLTPAPLSPGLNRRIVAFYLDHVAAAVERLASDTATGGAVPFSPPIERRSSAPASPPPMAVPSGSN